ncbi:MAG: hypothetical protein KGH83_08040, partial [Thaumarchaeota archaeon]|nr:hypothetical protein [Nitrososphaerota archaeon]
TSLISTVDGPLTYAAFISETHPCPLLFVFSGQSFAQGLAWGGPFLHGWQINRAVLVTVTHGFVARH